MKTISRLAPAVSALLLGFASPSISYAHCDTLDGPVIADARAALAVGQADPVLKWVRADGEAEVRAAFEQTLAVRRLSPQAAALADRWFFENLVRIHRAGEGETYTGLKSGSELDSGIASADRALASGEVGPLLEASADHVRNELRARFERVREAARHKDHTVAAGRAYVEAYVAFIHYAESVLGPAETSTSGAHAAHAH